MGQRRQVHAVCQLNTNEFQGCIETKVPEPLLVQAKVKKVFQGIEPSVDDCPRRRQPWARMPHCT
jgi:hypothetical protein